MAPHTRPSDMLKMVRNTFGLNVKQAARVFDVERSTIYLWAATTDAAKICAANFERVRQLFRLAEQCRTKGALPSDALRMVLQDGSTLLDQLSANPLNERQILDTWAHLGTTKAALGQARRQRSDDFAKAIAAGVVALGDKEALKRELARRFRS